MPFEMFSRGDDQVVAVELHQVEAALIEVGAAEGGHDLRVGRIADVDDGDVLGVGHVGQVAVHGDAGRLAVGLHAAQERLAAHGQRVEDGVAVLRGQGVGADRQAGRHRRVDDQAGRARGPWNGVAAAVGDADLDGVLTGGKGAGVEAAEVDRRHVGQGRQRQRHRGRGEDHVARAVQDREGSLGLLRRGHAVEHVRGDGDRLPGFREGRARGHVDDRHHVLQGRRDRR